MIDSTGDNRLDELAEEFVARVRLGERPALTEYTTRHPELADHIRELFPLLITMEQVRPETPGDSGRSRARVPDLPFWPQQIGDYRLLREVGRGGMGVVFEAEQASLGRHVAVKVLLRHSTLDPRHLQRFQREARAAARLHHTNIVPVFGVGEHEGLNYYVMQFIHGQGLDKVLFELRALRDQQVADGPTSPKPLSPVSSTSEDCSLADVSAADVAESLLQGEIAEESEQASRRASAPGQQRQRPGADVLRLAGITNNAVLDPDHVETGRASEATSSTSLRQTGWAYWQSVARIGVQVAEALDYAAGQGILHRDIKPSNLLLDTNGTVWVADFGLAKANDSADLTQTGDIIGTLRYLAPERLHGESDLRGDLYSLGMTLYELLTLRPAFRESDHARLLRMIAQDDPPPPHTIDPRIPRDLETIALKALAKDPSLRYQTASEMADDLRQFLDDKPIRARPIGTIERFWRWCRRNPRVALLVSSVALLLVIVAVGTSVAAAFLKRERDSARDSERKANTAEKARRQELYRANLNEARPIYMSGRLGQRLRGLDAIRKIVAELPPQDLTHEQRAELRDEAISFLAVTDMREIARSPSHAVGMFDVDIDDRLETLAHGEERLVGSVLRPLAAAKPSGSVGSPATARTATARSQLIATEPTPSPHRTTRRFSPSGRWLAERSFLDLGDDNPRLRIWDCQSKRLALDINSVGNGDWAFHPDDRHLLVTDAGSVLTLYDIANGKIVGQSPPRFAYVHFAFSPNGEHLAIASLRSPAEVLDSKTWTTVATLPAIGSTTAVAWNPAESDLVFGTSDGRLYRWNPRDGVGFFLAGAHRADVTGLCFSSDGQLLASSSWGDDQLQIRQMLTNQLLLTMNGRALRFSQSGRRLAVIQDGQLVIFEHVAALAHATIEHGCEMAEFSPDGQWLALSGEAGVHLLSANSLTHPANLELDHCGPVAFRPDGRMLLTYGFLSHARLWPLGPSESDGRTYRVGPSEQALRPPVAKGLLNGLLTLEPQHRGRHAAWSQDGKVLSLVDYRKGEVLVTDGSAKSEPRLLGRLNNAHRVAVSPDGQWVAAGAFLFLRSQVWRATNGEVVLDLPDLSNVAFSDDGQWFAASSLREVRLYRVPSWKFERVIKIDKQSHVDCAPFALQPHGTLIAVADSYRQVRLYDRETGLNVANLTYLDPANCTWLSFNPDGHRLTVTRAAHGVSIWDLRHLQTELTELGLGIEGVRFSESRESSEAHGSGRSPNLLLDREVTVDRGSLPPPRQWAMNWRMLALGESRNKNWPDAVFAATQALKLLPESAPRDRSELLTLRGFYNLRKGTARAACDDWQQAVSIVPENADAVRRLTRLYLLGPIELREPERALALISALIARDDRDPESQLLLGISQVRLGRFAPASATLQKLVEFDSTKPYALYFLALAHWQLGQREEAQKWYAQAAESAQTINPTDDEELARLKVEAAQWFEPSKVSRPRE